MFSNELLKPATALIVTGIFVCVFVTRRVTELVWPAVHPSTPRTPAQNYWEKLALPLAPVLVGMGLVLVVPPDTYPTVAPNLGSKLLLGCLLGCFNGLFFRIIKALIQRQFNVEASDGDVLG